MNTDTISALIRADVPVLLWGPPGVGKTSAIEALAKASGAHIETLIGSTIDPPDVGGWLLPEDGRMAQYPPPWARRLHEKGGWLFLDELSCAPPSVQAALLRVVCDRQVAGLDLSGCRILAAANPADTAADGGMLSAAMANRWAHIDWELSAQEWVSGELTGWGTPRPPHVAASAATVTQFIRVNPGALLSVPKHSTSGKAWPSPRSWSKAILGLSHAPRSARLSIVAACVGPGAASEWAAWEREQDLPNPEAILGGQARLPERPDQVMASVVAVASVAIADHPERDKRIGAAVDIIADLSEVRPDAAIPGAQVVLKGLGGFVPDRLMPLAERAMVVRSQL